MTATHTIYIFNKKNIPLQIEECQACPLILVATSGKENLDKLRDNNTTSI